MNPVAYAALILWPVAALALASWLRAPRSVVAAGVIAWLFLPEGGHDLDGPLDLTKINVTSIGLLLGLACLEPDRLLRIRWSPADLPIAAVCVCPLLSSLDNGLGAYDGLSECVVRILMWGIPWIVGRACFASLDDMRALVLGVILGGLVYIPFCLYEIRMSPQLHRIVYGFFPHAEFAQTRRFGGFRPNVFMQHGLMVGLWMCLTAMAGAWMWQRGRLRALLGLPVSLVVPAHVLTAILCKSAGAIVIGAAGWALLALSGVLRTRLVLLALCLVAPAYIAYRVADGSTTHAVEAIRAVPLLADRADSLEYRFDAEAIILDHARQRPLLGWGGQGRHRPRNEDGEQLTRTDSLWIIVLGQNGVIGLIALFGALLIPGWVAARHVPAGVLLSPHGAPLLIVAAMTSLYAVDSLVNAMPNPIYVMGGGGVVATVAALRRAASRPSQRAARIAAGQPAPPAPRLAPSIDPGAGDLLRRAHPDAAHPALRLRVPPGTPSPTGRPTPTPPPDRLSIPWRAPRS